MFINDKGDWGIYNDSVEEFTQRLKEMGYDGPFEYREEEI